MILDAQNNPVQQAAVAGTVPATHLQHAPGDAPVFLGQTADNATLQVTSVSYGATIPPVANPQPGPMVLRDQER